MQRLRFLLFFTFLIFSFKIFGSMCDGPVQQYKSDAKNAKDECNSAAGIAEGTNNADAKALQDKYSGEDSMTNYSSDLANLTKTGKDRQDSAKKFCDSYKKVCDDNGKKAKQQIEQYAKQEKSPDGCASQKKQVQEENDSCDREIEDRKTKLAQGSDANDKANPQAKKTEKSSADDPNKDKQAGGGGSPGGMPGGGDKKEDKPEEKPKTPESTTTPNLQSKGGGCSADGAGGGVASSAISTDASCRDALGPQCNGFSTTNCGALQSYCKNNPDDNGTGCQHVRKVEACGGDQNCIANAGNKMGLESVHNGTGAVGGGAGGSNGSSLGASGMTAPIGLNAKEGNSKASIEGLAKMAQGMGSAEGGGNGAMAGGSGFDSHLFDSLDSKSKAGRFPATTVTEVHGPNSEVMGRHGTGSAMPELGQMHTYWIRYQLLGEKAVKKPVKH